MSSTVGGFVTGILALTFFEAVVSSSAATGRVGGAFTGIATIIQHIASPNVPAIPDLRLKNTGAPGTASATTTSSAGVRNPIAAPTKYGTV